MKRIKLALGCAALFAALACDNVEALDDGLADGTSQSAQQDDGTDDADTGDAAGSPPPAMDAMDIVFVVDNSGSMQEEQAIFATSVIHLVNTLTTPRSSWPYPAVDDLRVAVVSSDMGISANGVIPDENDTPSSLTDYRDFGDDGAFQPISVDSVTVADGVVPCDGTEGQCPAGWACFADDETGEQSCRAPEGATDVACPALEDAYAQRSAEAPNSALGVEVACLTSLGTQGIGWEQQLASAARATARADQASFFREDAGLGVVIVSDEDDCSMDDAKGLFATPECQDPYRLNIACGMNGEYLHTAEYYKNAFTAVKGGYAESVFVAAIVGVPADDACQGSGSVIGACLDAPEMQATPYQPNLEDDDERWWYFEPACTRTEGDVVVTSATPGRRFVELAEAMGENGYVFSICNENWIPAMEAYASILAGAVAER